MCTSLLKDPLYLVKTAHKNNFTLASLLLSILRKLKKIKYKDSKTKYFFKNQTHFLPIIKAMHERVLMALQVPTQTFLIPGRWELAPSSSSVHTCL